MKKRDVERIWINGCAQWIIEHRACGWTPYYINFMFNPLPGPPERVLELMKEAISGEFYSKFLLAFVRHPKRQREVESMPRLKLFPDLWAYKRNKIVPHKMDFNSGGYHFNGPLLIPPKSRFVGCPIEHIQFHKNRYTGGKIEHIFIEPIDERVYGISDYSAKTVKWGRADDADILLLPKAISEVTDRRLVLNPEQRAIRDIQSSMNVSEEVARGIYRRQRT